MNLIALLFLAICFHEACAKDLKQDHGGCDPSDVILREVDCTAGRRGGCACMDACLNQSFVTGYCSNDTCFCQKRVVGDCSDPKDKCICGKKVDLVFVLDISLSVIWNSLQNPQAEKDFFKAMTNEFNPDGDYVQISVMTFANGFWHLHQFKEVQNPQVISAKIQGIVFPNDKASPPQPEVITFRGRGTDISTAMTQVHNLMKANSPRYQDPTVKKLVLYATDGEQDPNPKSTHYTKVATKPEAVVGAMRAEGVEVQLVLLGDKVNATDLKAAVNKWYKIEWNSPMAGMAKNIAGKIFEAQCERTVCRVTKEFGTSFCQNETFCEANCEEFYGGFYGGFAGKLLQWKCEARPGKAKEHCICIKEGGCNEVDDPVLPDPNCLKPCKEKKTGCKDKCNRGDKDDDFFLMLMWKKLMSRAQRPVWGGWYMPWYPEDSSEQSASSEKSSEEDHHENCTTNGTDTTDDNPDNNQGTNDDNTNDNPDNNQDTNDDNTNDNQGTNDDNTNDNQDTNDDNTNDNQDNTDNNADTNQDNIDDNADTNQDNIDDNADTNQDNIDDNADTNQNTTNHDVGKTQNTTSHDVGKKTQAIKDQGGLAPGGGE